MCCLKNVQRGSLVHVLQASYEAIDAYSILGGAVFPGSGVADFKCSESRGGYSSDIKMPAAKSSRDFP